ncbi:transglutaminase domain-containing protein [Streptacidiphilus sp. N1-12]|uniref:Transglutaminase domain-containing protein n=2 Tax=Streptacidiphilus alkalitolerans TaxID=3342712 RepID=A0ABV6WQB6_9ACTN
MTSSLLQQRRPRAHRAPTAAAAGAKAEAKAVAGAVRPVPGGTAPTGILDWQHPRVRHLLEQVRAHEPAAAGPGPLALLQAAHQTIVAEIRPVYSLDDRRPVSETLRRGRGSCSQRLAVLEAVARASGVPTRVRGLLVDGAFWYPRFPRLRFLVPDHVVLAWPEFQLDGGWLPASELFGSLPELSTAPGGGFTNSGGETMFEALSRTAVDWDGATRACPESPESPGSPGSRSSCDLSASISADLGHYSSRDLLFADRDQTLCWAARRLGEPVLGRWSAGGRTT